MRLVLCWQLLGELTVSQAVGCGSVFMQSRVHHRHYCRDSSYLDGSTAW
jgi:hypothetical protein